MKFEANSLGDWINILSPLPCQVRSVSPRAAGLRVPHAHNLLQTLFIQIGYFRWEKLSRCNSVKEGFIAAPSDSLQMLQKPPFLKQKRGLYKSTTWRLQNSVAKKAMRLIGYARVSTDDQTPALQLDALRAAGAVELFEDRGISGATRDRPGLVAALSALRLGDVLMVWRLDRLGRSLADLIEMVNTLKAKGCGFRSLTEAIDTSTAGGELVFHVFGAMAQFERSLGIERTRAGLAAAKHRGARLGRKPSLTASQVEHAHQLIKAGESPPAVAKSLNVSRSTLWRALAALPSSHIKA